MKQPSNIRAGGSALFTLVSGIVILLAVVFFCIKLAGSGSFGDVAATTESATQTRIQPVGQVTMGDGIAVGERKGDQIFNKICIQCHAADSIVPNAPKLDNKGDWAPRIAQGFDTLFQHALNGFNAMPAKGGAADLTDQELKRVITYMANKGGPASPILTLPRLPMQRLPVRLPPPLPLQPTALHLPRLPQQMPPKRKIKARPPPPLAVRTAKKSMRQAAKPATAAPFPAFPMSAKKKTGHRVSNKVRTRCTNTRSKASTPCLPKAAIPA